MDPDPSPSSATVYRNIQPQVVHAFHNSQALSDYHDANSSASLSASNNFQNELRRLQNHDPLQAQPYLEGRSFGPHRHRPLQPLQPLQPASSPHTPQQRHIGSNNVFDVLTPDPAQHNSLSRAQQDEDIRNSPDNADQSNGHAGTRIVENPPNLEAWRERLFNVNEKITLSEEEFQIYFPHVDNIYSHRSTQRYKRKPFVSHYWDCRLKGRPPGTPKSDDPNKRKRKRVARERDLCDVKIKITEYFPGAMLRPDFAPEGFEGNVNVGSTYTPTSQNSLAVQEQQSFRMPLSGQISGGNHPGSSGQRYYTIQRVNGNGANGKGDGIAGPHKHTLADSDKVKKNSIQRYVMKRELEEKKSQKKYHRKASGSALATVRKHSKDHALKLFGSCFCPFVQRVWIALEAKRLQYQYIEVDPYKKPQALLEVNPRGLVPGIRHGDWGCGESTVLMEYLEDMEPDAPLLPTNNPRLRATCRLWTDHINRRIVPAFYALLQAQSTPEQVEHAKKLTEHILTLVEACPDPDGPFFLGQKLSFVDIQLAPWMIRMKRVLKPYRDWPEPTPGSRWARWLDAVESNEHVKATTSSEELYIDSYERYAENRPGTSQLADAVNSGQGLP